MVFYHLVYIFVDRGFGNFREVISLSNCCIPSRCILRVRQSSFGFIFFAVGYICHFVTIITHYVRIGLSVFVFGAQLWHLKTNMIQLFWSVISDEYFTQFFRDLDCTFFEDDQSSNIVLYFLYLLNCRFHICWFILFAAEFVSLLYVSRVFYWMMICFLYTTLIAWWWMLLLSCIPHLLPGGECCYYLVYHIYCLW